MLKIAPEEREALNKTLKSGWGRLGSKLKGCEDEILVRKLLICEMDNRNRTPVVVNLYGRLHSLERKRVLNQILKRRKPSI
jgi:hypothetical protein